MQFTDTVYSFIKQWMISFFFWTWYPKSRTISIGNSLYLKHSKSSKFMFGISSPFLPVLLYRKLNIGPFFYSSSWHFLIVVLNSQRYANSFSTGDSSESVRGNVSCWNLQSSSRFDWVSASNASVWAYMNRSRFPLETCIRLL